MTSPIDGLRLTLTPPPATGPAASAWTVGQLLQAIVDSQSADGVLTLRIGTRLLEGRSELPLRPGQSLTLQVAQTGTPTVLRIVTDAATETDAVNHALRQALPRQGEMRPLLAALTELARTPPSLPPALTAVVHRILSRLPAIQNLAVPGELKQALLESGQFLETRLAHSAAMPEHDFKAALLHLQGILRNIASPVTQHETPDVTPPAPYGIEARTVDMLQQRTEAALARLVLNQVDSLPHETPATTPLVVELPLRWNDQPAMLWLRIEPDDTARHAGNMVPGWSVWLSFEPGELGPVHCRLQLRGEQVSATFWAERETTAALFRQHLEKLGSGLQQEGLTPRHLHCQTGKPPLPAPRRHDLLDERA